VLRSIRVIDPLQPFGLELARFAIRPATLADADDIARVQTESWQQAYRGILPDRVLDHIDVGQRAASRRSILRDTSSLHLVAYETTRGELVGFCDAGVARRRGPWAGEVYAIYLLHHARRYGLGRELFERVIPWLVGCGLPSMIVWVLERNTHARRFYEALGGRSGPRLASSVGGFPVVEVGYVWERLPTSRR